MNDELKVATLKQTCPSYPSQWEGLLTDGRSIFIRYRWGKLSIAVAETFDKAIDVFGRFSNDGLLFSEEFGDNLSGECTLEDVAALMPQVDFSAVEP